MNRTRTFLAICALALPISLVAAGCGGDDAADRDPREVVERSFDNDTEVTSGVVELAFSGSVTGEESGSFSAGLDGSFQTEEGDARSLPQLDLSGTVTGEGGGESIDESARLIVTDSNAFVEYGGEMYEAGEQMYSALREEVESEAEGADAQEGASFRQACEEAMRQADGDPSACDIDFASDWLTNLENEGTEDVEGTETVHVSGDLNVEQVLADLAELGRTVPGFNLEGFEPSQLAPAVPEATFDLYSGVDDEELRRLEVELVIEPSAVTGGLSVVPVERAEIGFSYTLSELNEPQTIEPPSGPTTPLQQLFEGMGPGALGGGLGLPELEDGDGGDSEPAPPEDGSSGGGQGGSNGGGQGGSGPGAADELPENIDPQQAEEYLECIQDAAQSGDQDALNACAELL